MTYPFAGEIKMTKVIKDGKEVIEWERVDLTYHADGNVGIGTPPQVKSAPLVMGEPVERMRISMLEEIAEQPRQWQGLTNDEIDTLYEAHHNQYGECKVVGYGYERAIEAKLREKNNAR
jgi:hypothetical protein